MNDTAPRPDVPGRTDRSEARSSDRYIVDAIAAQLGTAASWEPEDLETVAFLIGKVRPHPGNADAETYAETFRARMGRDVPRAYDRNA